MNIRYTRIDSLDDLFDELYDFINGELEKDNQTCTDDNLKCKYDYKCDNSKKHMDHNVDDLNDVIVQMRNEYDELRKTYMDLKHKDEILEKRYEELLKAGKEVSKEGHAIADKCNSIISDKVRADGYKIATDIKVWFEFARKCGMLNNYAYTDMLDMIKKTLSCAPEGKE